MHIDLPYEFAAGRPLQLVGERSRSQYLFDLGAGFV
eukprot:SAG11_NODE_19321_length_469_cov_0.897297_2_plen_35_part_01